MKRATWPALLALCACDRALHLGATALADGADAAFFDAPITTGCPATGTPPRYTDLLVQDIKEFCGSYTFSAAAGLAIAICYDANGTSFVGEGPLDQPLVPATGLDDSTCPTGIIQIGADGTAYVTCLSRMSGKYEFRTFTKANGVWTRGPDVLASGGFRIVSPATATTPQHLLYIEINGYTLHELVGSPSSWVDIGSTPIASLGVTNPLWLAPTSDGLHLAMLAGTTTNPNSHALYTDRARLGDAFGAVSVLAGVPAADSIYMTDDCSRLYLTGLENVWFVDELKQ